MAEQPNPLPGADAELEKRLFVVRHGDRCYGPFRSYESQSFAATLPGAPDVWPLFSPPVPGEVQGPYKVRFLSDAAYREHVDRQKIDTSHVLIDVLQEFYFSRRDQRVFTAREMLSMWKALFTVSKAIESLMHFAELAINDPSSDHLEQLRKAFWRNRDSDDVDPHYHDRFW